MNAPERLDTFWLSDRVVEIVEIAVKNYIDWKLKPFIISHTEIENALANPESFGNYWAIEFQEDEVHFLENHLDLESSSFYISIDNTDIEKIKNDIAIALRAGGTSSEVLPKLATSWIVEAKVAEYFEKNGFSTRWQKSIFAKSAEPFISNVVTILERWFDQLLEDTVVPYVLWLKELALEYDKLALQRSKNALEGNGELIPESELEKSLRFTDVRAVIVDPNSDIDSIRVRFLAMPMATLDETDNPKFIPAVFNPEMHCERMDWFKFLEREQRPSALSFFLWDKPFKAEHPEYHWANVLGWEFKRAIFKRVNLPGNMMKKFESFATDEGIGLKLQDNDLKNVDFQSGEYPQFATFRLMSDEEIASEIRQKQMQEDMAWTRGTVRRVLAYWKSLFGSN